MDGVGSRLVVKNTFIDIVDDQLLEPQESSGRLRVRASSDPSLFETSLQEARRHEFDCSLEESNVEFELHGMSDEDAKTEDEGVAALPCYSHIPEERVADISSTSASADTPILDSPAPEPFELHDDAPVHWSAPSSNGDIERLISENARLALENKMLRSQCLGPPANSSSQAQVASTGQTSHHQSSMPTSSPEALWVPFGFMMPAQAHSQARTDASATGLGGSEAADPLQPSRRQRRRSAAQRTVMVTSPASCTGPADAAASDMQQEAPLEKRTTVMLRNLPNNYTRAMVLAMLDSEGFAGKYDFLYLPIDFKSRACLGYAFINLVDAVDVGSFWNRFDGFSKWILPSKKICHVSWSGPHQGLEAHLDRYRNSPVMHRSVPDEYKPVVFRDGVRVVFPPPTKNPRAPRIRHMADFRASAGAAQYSQAFAAPLPC